MMRICPLPHKKVAVWALALLVVGFPGAVPVVSAQTALSWSPRQQAAAERLPVVRVATDSTWPPMEYINRERELVGFDIDLLREIGRRVGFRPHFETVAWDGIFAGLAAGQYDMIASSVTLLEERRRAMLFSRPYFRAAQYLVVPRTDTNTRTLSDLTGGTVGAQIATTGSRLVSETPGVALRSYDDLGLAVEDLFNRRLNGIVADTAIVEFYLLANDRYGETLRVVEEPYAVEDYAFAIALDQPELKRAIDRGLEEMEAEGELERLRKFWFRHLDPGSAER